MSFMGCFFIASWNRRFYRFGLMPTGTRILFPLPLPLRMLFKKGKLSSINMFFLNLQTLKNHKNIQSSDFKKKEEKLRKLLWTKACKYLGIKGNAFDLILKGQSCRDGLQA